MLYLCAASLLLKRSLNNSVCSFFRLTDCTLMSSCTFGALFTLLKVSRPFHWSSQMPQQLQMIQYCKKFRLKLFTLAALCRSELRVTRRLIWQWHNRIYLRWFILSNIVNHFSRFVWKHSGHVKQKHGGVWHNGLSPWWLLRHAHTHSRTRTHTRFKRSTCIHAPQPATSYIYWNRPL